MPKRTGRLPIPKCWRAWRSWGASRSKARRRISARSSPPRRRSGRRSSSPRARKWSDAPCPGLSGFSAAAVSAGAGCGPLRDQAPDPRKRGARRVLARRNRLTARGEIGRAYLGEIRPDDDVGKLALCLRERMLHDDERVAQHRRGAAELLVLVRLPRDVDGDDEVGARFARDLHRHRAHEAAVDVFAPAYRGGLENHRHAARGAHRHAGVAAREGDEPAGGKLGGDRDERNFELLDQAPLQSSVDVGLKPIAFDETAVRKYEVDQLLALHGDRGLERLVVAYAAGVERCHQAARARADHEVGADSGVIEDLQDPGVGETARAAAAEHERDQRAVRPADQDQWFCARRVLGRGRQASAGGDPQGEREDNGRCGAEERSRAGHRKIVSASPEDGNSSPFAPIHVRLRTDRSKVPDGTLVNAGEYASNSYAQLRLTKVRRRDRLGQSARGYRRSPLRLACRG